MSVRKARLPPQRLTLKITASISLIGPYQPGYWIMVGGTGCYFSPPRLSACLRGSQPVFNPVPTTVLVHQIRI